MGDPLMGDPRDPLMDPAGVPVGRDNLGYGGMINFLFPPQRRDNLGYGGMINFLFP